MEIMNTFPDISLPEALKRSVARFADFTAIDFGDRKLTFSSFDDISDKIAVGLTEQGISCGDRVALYCVNSDAFALTYFAILKTGATVVPINLLLNPREIAYILKDAGVSTLIYFEVFAEAVAAIGGMVPDLKKIIRIGTGETPAGQLDWQNLLKSSGALPAIEITPAEDVAAIIYTSGTTGYPKGAMLTHRNLVANVWSVSRALPLEAGKDSIVVVLPMFHAFAATASMLYPLLHGMTVIPLPRFDPAATAETIARTQASLFMGVPSMFNVLLRLPDSATAKLSSLKYCISGGAAMPQQVMDSFEKRFSKLIYEGDGPTECSPVTCVNPIGGIRKPCSVGLPVPLVEMRIMDEEGEECPLNEIGEICVRGPNVMKGYWNQPEETAAAFFDDWFRTGDLGTEDEDGYFYIVDRKKDMIIVNGMNVYPRMVEEVLYQHEAVREAAVVGEPHRTHGEIPIAYIALNEGTTVTDADIRAYCRENMGVHQTPRKIIFLAELPKNAAGKIMKRELRKTGEWERGIDQKP